MKRIIIAALIIFSALALTGCKNIMPTESEIMEQQNDANEMFVKVYESNKLCGDVVYDKSTHVMYWISNGAYTHGVMTMLVNSDGTPRIWEG